MRVLVTLAVTLVVAACATVRPPTLPGDLVDSFRVSGRFAVRAAEESGSGRLLWEHAPQSDDLTLSTPIGTGLAQLVRTKGQYTLSTNDGRVESDPDPDALTEKLLGWRLPIAGLPYWIRGRPLPDAPAQISRAANGRIETLRQSGWEIEYQAYHDELGVPQRMRLRRGALDLRLVLDQWQQAGDR